MSITKYLFVSLFLFPQFTYAAAALQGESAVAITHDSISCWPYDDFVVMEANIGPAEEIETARVYFRANDFLDFYYVEMTPNQEGLFEAVMPQPSQETDRVIYYIEAVDNEFNTSQTAEYDPNVVTSGSCDYRRFIGVPSIVIGSLVANASALPAGFQAAGITGFTTGAGAGGAAAGAAAGSGAAAGGISTVAVVGIGAAAAAGVVGVAAATGGDDDTTAGDGGGASGGGAATGGGGAAAPGGGTDPADADNDGDGFSENAGDCDDTDADVNPDGAVEFTDARFDPRSVTCPQGSTNFEFPVRIRFNGSNNSCETVTIDAVDVLVTVTRSQNVTNQVGQSLNYPNRPANPRSFEAGRSRNGILVTLPFSCQNPAGGPSGFFENDGVLTIRSSAGRFELTASNDFRLDVPLRMGSTAAGASRTLTLNWSSELTVRGGRGQVTFNGNSGAFVGTGRSQRRSTVQTGQNVVEAQLVAGNDRTGTWRFDFGNTGSFERGSLEVRTGNVELLTESSVVFRLSGNVGERVSFSFRGRR